MRRRPRPAMLGCAVVAAVVIGLSVGLTGALLWPDNRPASPTATLVGPDQAGERQIVATALIDEPADAKRLSIEMHEVAALVRTRYRDPSRAIEVNVFARRPEGSRYLLTLRGEPQRMIGSGAAMYREDWVIGLDPVKFAKRAQALLAAACTSHASFPSVEFCLALADRT